MPEKKWTILCVDDEQDIVDSLFDTFMDSYNVKTATSGEEAIDIFNKEDIALVITDQRMPGMTGTDLLSQVNEKKPICKKVLLTGYADINAAVSAINIGAVDKYFSKPWDDDELIKAVEHLLSMYDFDSFLRKMETDSKRILQDEKDMKGSLSSFEAFLDSYLTGVAVVSENKIEFINKQGLAITGYKSVSEVKGKVFSDIFSINDAKRLECAERHLKNEQIFEEIVMKSQDGTVKTVTGALTFSNDKSGASPDDLVISGIVYKES